MDVLMKVGSLIKVWINLEIKRMKLRSSHLKESDSQGLTMARSL